MPLTKVSYSMITGNETNILDIIPAAEHAAILAGNSTYNCGPDILTAINALKGASTAKALFFPKGTYVVDTQITVSNLVGFKFYGEGPEASIISYTPTTGALFYITAYRTCSFYDLSFTHAGFDAGRTCVGLRMNGTGGGTEVLLQNCLISYFNTAVTTTDAVGNDDTWTWNSCYFRHNINVWVNTNEQAVIWAWNYCQILYTTGTVFRNPGGYSRFVGGSYINQGIFCEMTSAVTGTSEILFDSIKFESTQNFTPPGTPQWLVIASSTGITCTFRNCNDSGGGIYAGTTFTLAGNYDITFDECVFSNGVMAVDATFNSGGFPSIITSINSSLPRMTEVTYPANGGMPVNKIYSNSLVKNLAGLSAWFTGGVKRNLTISTFTEPIQMAQQRFSLNALTVGAVDFASDVYIPIPIGGRFTITAIDFYYKDNSTATAVVTLWTDAAKGTKVYEYSKAASTGIKLARADVTSLITAYAMDYGSAPLHFTIVPTGDVGAVTVTMVITLVPFL